MPFENRGIAAGARAYLTKFLADGPQHIDAVRAGNDSIPEHALQTAARQLGIERKAGMWSLPSPGAPAREKPADWKDREEWAAAERERVATIAPGVRRAPRAPTLDSLAAKIERLRQQGRELEVYRYVDGTPAYLGSVSPREFSMGWLKRTYGGGRYAVEDVELAVDGPPLTAQPVASPPTSGAMDIGTLMVTMMQGQQNLLAALITNRENPGHTAPALDPIALMKTIDEMVARRVIPAVPQAPVAMDVIREAMRLGRASVGKDGDGGGDTGGDDGNFGKVLSIAQDVVGMINKKLAQPGQPAPAGAPPAAGTLPAGPTPETDVPVTVIERVVDELKPFLSQMAARAGAGTNPADVASYVVRSVDDSRFALLADAADRPQFEMEIMAALKPLIYSGHTEWFASLARELKLELARQSEDDDDSPDT